MRAFLSSRTLDLSTKKLGGKSYANRTDAKNGRIVSDGVNNRRRYYFEQLKFTRDENLYFFRKKGGGRKGRKERKRKEKKKRKKTALYAWKFSSNISTNRSRGGGYGVFGKKIRWRESTKGERTEKERRNNIQRCGDDEEEGSRNRCKIGRGPAHFRRSPFIFRVGRFIEGMRRGGEIREIVYICQTRPSRKHFESFLMLEAS